MAYINCASSPFDLPTSHNNTFILFVCTDYEILSYPECFISSDVIMDMLGDRKMRKIVNSYYDDSGEPTLVRKAVAEAYSKEQDYNEDVDGRGNMPGKLKKLR